MCYQIQACPSKLKVLHIYTCAVEEYIHVKLTRPADVKIDMFKQAHRLAGSHICKVFW